MIDPLIEFIIDNTSFRLLLVSQHISSRQCFPSNKSRKILYNLFYNLFTSCFLDPFL